MKGYYLSATEKCCGRYAWAKYCRSKAIDYKGMPVYQWIEYRCSKCKKKWESR